MYYIIETDYVGPNQDKYINDHTVSIGTSPAYTNQSHEARIEGWCGTTNDWSVYAHGVYDTLDEAVCAVKEIFGEVRQLDDKDNGEDESLIITFALGLRPRLTGSETINLYYEVCDVSTGQYFTADSTDEDISALITTLRDEGVYFDYAPDYGALEDYIRTLRDSLKTAEKNVSDT